MVKDQPDCRSEGQKKNLCPGENENYTLLLAAESKMNELGS